MSNKAVNWARNVPDLTPTEAFVLWVICDRYNEHVGSAWPSIKTIARDTRYSTSTVARALNTLTEKGLLTRKKTLSDKHYGWVSNTYFLPDFDPRTDLAKARKLEVIWSKDNADTKFREVADADYLCRPCHAVTSL